MCGLSIKNKSEFIEVAVSILILVLIAFAFGTARSATSKRNVFEPNSTYETTPPPVTPQAAITTDFSTWPTLHFTMTLTADVPVDAHVECKVFNDEKSNYGWVTISSGGTPYSKMWKWELASTFDGSYTVGPQQFDYNAYVNTPSVGHENDHSDVVCKFRYLLRYDNNGVIEKSRWFYSGEFREAQKVDTVPPTIISYDAPVAVYQIGGVYVIVKNLEIDDQPLSTRCGIKGFALDTTTGEKFKISDLIVGTYGTGNPKDVTVAKIPNQSIADLVAAGRNIWEVYIEIVDATGNSTGVVQAGTVDMRNY